MPIVYFAVLFAVASMGYAAEANPKLRIAPNKKLIITPDPGAVMILSAVLVFVAGFRYNVGTDFGVYYRWTISSWDKVWNNILFFHEGGFSLLVKISRSIYDHGQTMIILASAITVGLYCRTIYKYHSMLLVSFLLYIFMGEWQGSFNGIRQYLAAAIVFAGHRYILSRDWLKYGIVVFVASMFHTTAIVMIVPFFLFTRKADITQIVLLSIGAMIIRFSYDIIFSLIGGYKGSIMNVNGDAYLSNDISILRILVAFVPVLIYIVFCRKEQMTDEQNFYINALFFNAFSMVAAMGSTYFGRIGIYTAAASVIGYGYMFDLIDDEKTQRIIIVTALLLYFLYWLYSVSASGIVDFQFCFYQD